MPAQATETGATISHRCEIQKTFLFYAGELRTRTAKRDAYVDLQRAVAQVTGIQGVSLGIDAERLFMADRFYSDRNARNDVREVHGNIATVYGRGTQIIHRGRSK